MKKKWLLVYISIIVLLIIYLAILMKENSQIHILLQNNDEFVEELSKIEKENDDLHFFNDGYIKEISILKDEIRKLETDISEQHVYINKLLRYLDEYDMFIESSKQSGLINKHQNDNFYDIYMEIADVIYQDTQYYSNSEFDKDFIKNYLENNYIYDIYVDNYDETTNSYLVFLSSIRQNIVPIDRFDKGSLDVRSYQYLKVRIIEEEIYIDPIL